MVYDLKTDKAYVLSPSAAGVWRAANGERVGEGSGTVFEP